jgi:hypothetical protein
MEEKDENCRCCDCCFVIDDFWNRYKYTIAPKLSISIGVMGGVVDILSGLGYTIPMTVVSSLCSASVFFAGVMLEHFKNNVQNLEDEKKNLETDNISLQNQKEELRVRLNTFCFPISQNITPSNEPINSEIHTTGFITPIDADRCLNKRNDTLKP